MRSICIGLWMMGSLLIAGCSSDDAEPEAKLEIVSEQNGFPVFADQHLQFGQAVWMGTCLNCHARGVADAPIVTDFSAWEARINKGKPVLYEHALNGFFGEDDSMMPARGGNDALSDDEVRAAVDYMVRWHSVSDTSEKAD